MSVSQQLGNVPLEPPAVPGAESPEAAEVPGVRGWNLESDDRGGGGGGGVGMILLKIDGMMGDNLKGNFPQEIQRVREHLRGLSRINLGYWDSHLCVIFHPAWLGRCHLDWNISQRTLMVLQIGQIISNTLRKWLSGMDGQTMMRQHSYQWV